MHYSIPSSVTHACDILTHPFVKVTFSSSALPWQPWSLRPVWLSFHTESKLNSTLLNCVGNDCKVDSQMPQFSKNIVDLHLYHKSNDNIFMSNLNGCLQLIYVKISMLCCWQNKFVYNHNYAILWWCVKLWIMGLNFGLVTNRTWCFSEVVSLL